MTGGYVNGPGGGDDHTSHRSDLGNEPYPDTSPQRGKLQPSAETPESPTNAPEKNGATAAELADLLLTDRYRERIEMDGIDSPGLLTDALDELER
jgi:hypothetical protein